jgi:xylulokinase
MDSSPILLGLDVGTTNIKAVAFDPRGRIVAHASVKTPTHYPRPGRAYYKPTEIWASVVQVVRAMTADLTDPDAIVSMAVASIGETGFPLDERVECIYDALAWFDDRTEPQANQIEAIVGRDRLFATTGLGSSAIFTLPKLLWLKQNEPDVYARTVTWLNTADYIAFRLCGFPATDYSLASRTQALDLRALRWDEALIREVGLSSDLFAPLAPGGTLLGRVSPDIAASIGLPDHVTVAVGGHDHICGAMALGVTEPGTLLDSIGTAEGVLLPLERPITDPVIGHQGYEFGAHVSGGYYGMPAIRTAGVCIDWFRSVCAGDADYATLAAEAEATPPGASGVRFQPHLRLPHSPSNDPQSRGAFIGLSTDVTRGAMFRAVLEGLAFEARAALEPLLVYAGIDELSRIYAIGGGARSRLLMEIKATVLNRTIHIAGVEEAAALGAAILGGVGAGVFADVTDALSGLQRKLTPVEPLAGEVALYDAIYRQVYLEMYPALRELDHANYGFKYGT